jgi:alkanesulfonate monooxygenase SsuD/methylene tetrahydromethanopterin reductase-like flavin-dependent oxidoreductase (luciferase family)
MNLGFVASPTHRADATDADLYDEAAEDCVFAQSAGYNAAWFIEHHFSDYFPTPSPFVFMASIAARCPDLDLGTCATVTPWYHPLRYAEEVAMLSHITRGNLYIGMGRGSAPMEYEAYGIDQTFSREIFAEHWQIVRQAFSGKPFSVRGDFTKMGREVVLRPMPARERVHFLGAVSSQPTARLMGEYGLRPLCSSAYPLALQAQMLAEWRQAAGEAGADTTMPATAMVHLFIADTDADAEKLCRQYGPLHFQQQIVHYEIGKADYDGIKGYENFNRMMGTFRKLADPAQIDPWMNLQFVGSPETCLARLRDYRAAGIENIIIHTATAGIPRGLRHEMLARFAREVAGADTSSELRRAG